MSAFEKLALFLNSRLRGEEVTAHVLQKFCDVTGLKFGPSSSHATTILLEEEDWCKYGCSACGDIHVKLHAECDWCDLRYCSMECMRGRSEEEAFKPCFVCDKLPCYKCETVGCEVCDSILCPDCGELPLEETITCGCCKKCMRRSCVCPE